MLNISHFRLDVTTLSPLRMAVALANFIGQMLSVWVFHMPVVVSLGFLLAQLVALYPAFISRSMRYIWLAAMVLFLIFFLTYLLLPLLADPLTR